ncbi:hypothetical protein V8D89_006526 [Ganoderma adspersum]
MTIDYPFSSTFQDVDVAPPLQLLVVASTIFLILSIKQYINRSKKVPLPPGPRPLPIVGNLFDIPKAFSPREYRELSDKYGDIVHLHAFGQRIIVLGSLEVATELLDKRSVRYSGKPYSAMSELIQAQGTVSLLSSGEAWRKQRRELHRFFSAMASTQWNAIQESGVRQLLSLLLDDPQHFSEHAEFVFGSMSMRVTYGMSPKDRHDDALALAMKGVKIMSQALVPGKYLVESFPILRHIPSWFPGARFQREAATWRHTWGLMRNKAFDDSIAKMRGGSFEHSMVTAMVQDAEGKGTFSPETDNMARDVSATVYIGMLSSPSHDYAELTPCLPRSSPSQTLTIFRIFLLAMALNPEVQRRVQAELDAVLGTNRLSSLSDRNSLPNVEALNPIVPFALPRTYTGEDDEYNGYRIPKGSLVIVNSWAFAHDPRNYADPEKFMPGRYLTREGKLNPEVRDPRTFTFGYGRRICPGRHFGDASVWIAVASVLHTFNISPPLDDKGGPVALTPKFTDGLLSTLPMQNHAQIFHGGSSDPPNPSVIKGARQRTVIWESYKPYALRYKT